MNKKILAAGLILLVILSLGCAKPSGIEQNASLELGNNTNQGTGPNISTGLGNNTSQESISEAGTAVGLNGTGVEGLFQKNNISTDGLKLIRVDNETLNGNNFSHVRVRQYVNGIPVSGFIIYHFRNGEYYFLSGTRLIEPNNETQPKISRQQALDIACQASKVGDCNHQNAEKVDCSRFFIEKIYWRTSGDRGLLLAWEVKYNSTGAWIDPIGIGTPVDITIDAQDGGVLYNAPWEICG